MTVTDHTTDSILTDEQELLAIHVERPAGGIRLRIVGELDITAGTVLDRALSMTDGFDTVELDLTDVTFVDSYGLATLLEPDTAPSTRALTIVGASRVVRRLLQIVGEAARLPA